MATKIPAGLIVPRHTDEAHYYEHTPSGIVAASITTKSGIIDVPHLKVWAAKLATEHIDKNWEVLKDASVEQRSLIFKAAVLVHRDQFYEAGAVGTAGHKVIEKYLLDWIAKGEKPRDITAYIDGDDARLWAIARSAEQFINDFEAEPIVSEQLVFSVRHKAGGTLDALMMVSKVIKEGTKPPDLFDGKECVHLYYAMSMRNPRHLMCGHCGREVMRVFALIDWKTANSVDKPDYAIQGSTYDKCLKELTGLKTEEILIVRLDKDRKQYEVVRVVDRTAAFKAYTHIAKVWDWMSDGKEKIQKMNPRPKVYIGSSELAKPIKSGIQYQDVK